MKSLRAALLFTVCVTAAFAQSSADTAFVSAAIQNTVARYHEAIGGQAKLYNGSRYPDHDGSLDEHPFFLSEDWVMGDVFYDGEFFQGVPLMYDIVSGQLVTEHLFSGHPIQLVWGKLEHFSLSGHDFEKIENQTVGNSLPKTGFYDILYRGNTQVIALHQKIRRERIQTQSIEISFPEKTHYFIFKNGVFFQVQSKASVFKVLEDEKQALKRYLKSNHIIFSLNRESALTAMAELYDNLKKR
jgi:hypothetical protein